MGNDKLSNEKMNDEKTFNPYVWLVWGLPATVVVAGIITVVIAFTNADPLVSDDYYREGLAINQDKAADDRAAVLNLSADIKRVDASLIVELKAQIIYPKQLRLTFEHPTQDQQDNSWTLEQQSNGVYTVNIDPTLYDIDKGNWYITLAPLDKVWRLRATGNLSQNLSMSPST